MSEPLTLYKLMILYMLKQVKFPLSGAQISEFFLNKEYTTYFTLQQALSELNESHLIKLESTRNSRWMVISPMLRAILSSGARVEITPSSGMACLHHSMAAASAFTPCKRSTCANAALPARFAASTQPGKDKSEPPRKNTATQRLSKAAASALSSRTAAITGRSPSAPHSSCVVIFAVHIHVHIQIAVRRAIHFAPSHARAATLLFNLFRKHRPHIF